MADNKHIPSVYRPRKITVARAIGYGMPDMMGGGAFTLIGAWLLFFWTTYAGLTAIEAASILAIARVADAVISLFMGAITDNLYRFKIGKKFGRRHFFLLIGAPLMLEFILMWVTGMSYWYYLISYVLFELVAAMVLIPWETLPTEMTEDYNKRTMLSTARLVISSGSSFLATFLPGQLFKIFGEDSPMSYTFNAIVFAVIYMVSVFIAYKTTWERQITPEMAAKLEAKAKEGAGRTFGEQFKAYIATVKLRTFRKHLIVYLCTFTAKDTFNAVFAYFVVSVLGLSAGVSSGVLSLNIIGLPLTILVGYLLVKFSPRWVWCVGIVVELVALVGFWVLSGAGMNDLTMWLYVVGLVYNIGLGAVIATPWNVFPMIPDLDELVSGEHHEGLYASVMTFVRKSTVAVATFVVGLVLTEGGYVEGQIEQSIGTQHTITGILVFGTGALLVVALLTAATFRLNKTTHTVVKDELNRLRNGGHKADAPKETRELIEKLTGTKWEHIWATNPNQ
ncbi:major facilitator transporter [Bifidobacterium sp. UTCIF-39]|uniref:MFS transporter n=1 Tax=Bifidobacterium sp. UTCIF-39 TaxID=1465359 RepID=UPI00112DEE13|nr:MFS transporter [Bifidobacterium sp. UTCIF-39]TPF97911.1 major facilitator transporter [Bifidobacterium sp. UTCIF-39]